MRRNLSVVSSLVLASLMAVTAVISPREIEARRSLATEVTIRRDTYGVPHILAETEAAAAFGMGYAQAEDYAAEIALRFVTARGEQAKYLGTGAESDFRIKRYGNYEVAKNRFRELTPLFQRMLDAYAAGFNLYVEKHKSSLPDWVPVFDGVDVLAQGRAEVMRFAFDEGMIRAVQNKYPKPVASDTEPLNQLASPQGLPRADVEDSEYDDGSDLAGSNMWALSGTRTTSGKTILMGNPHQPWAALYWEAHVTVPGRINFYGSTFVGRPILTTGFNEYLGWSHTVNYPDLADIVALTLDPKISNHYIFNGKPMPITSKEVAVEIREPSGRLREERRTYNYSHLGPVVHQTNDKAFALKSAILDEFRYYEEWYALSKSKSIQEFVSHLKTNRIPMFNIAYADVEGNIGYWWNGMVPRRLDDGLDYRAEVPGESDRYVWKGLHGLEELPHLINPTGGYVQNCNDPPWWTSLRNGLDPKKYPSYIEPGRRLNLRTQMSLEMIESQQRFSLEDVKRLKYHTKMLIADRVKPDLIRAIKAVTNPSEDLKRGLAVIEAWDNHVARESRGAVLFKRFWDNYSTDTRTPYAVPWDHRDPARTPGGLADAGLAVKHFEEAVKWTRQTFGSESVAWGEVHRLRLGNVDLPMGGESGSYGLFRVVTYAPARDGKRVVGTVEKGKPMQGGGDGWIFAVEFSRPLTAYSVLAYGQTSNQASKHSTDQAALFANQEYKKVRFTEAEIKSNLERSYRPGD